MLPRFTLRTILFATTLVAIFFVFVGAGARGQNWAWGAAIGIGSIVVSLLVQSALFLVVWCFARLANRGSNVSGGASSTADREVAAP